MKKGDPVPDEETLYRRVRDGEWKNVEGQYRVSASAFNDRDREPSVDQASLRGHDPRTSMQSDTVGIAKLLTKEVRQIKEQKKNRETVVETYSVDVIHDPIENDPELEDNPAHAKIKPIPAMKGEPFKRLLESLARLATQTGWAISPVAGPPPGSKSA